jgi:putative tricarboxylic transport membrane protein
MQRERIPAVAFALALAVGATALLFVAWKIPVREVDMLLGPRLFPIAVMAALAVLATLLVVAGVLRRDESERAAVDEPSDWTAIGIVLAGLVLFGALVEGAGFVVAAAALFTTVARGFGSTRPQVDAAVGLVLAGTIYLLFVQALDLYLPGGSLFSAWTR